MQSVFLDEAGAGGPSAEETTLVGMTFGGYLRSKVCFFLDFLLRFTFVHIDFDLLKIKSYFYVGNSGLFLSCHDWNSQIKCMRCLGKSERCEQMMDLTVEIDGEIRTLEEALTQFTATETLDQDNKYYCSRLVHFLVLKLLIACCFFRWFL